MSSRYGFAVRADRRRAGLSLRAAAKKIGCDFTYLSKIENGIYVPSAATAERIAQVLGANVRSRLRLIGWHPCPRCDYMHRASTEGKEVTR